MENLATKHGRIPAARKTEVVRIPSALRPAVDDLVAHYREARVAAWEAAPLRQPEAQPDRAALT